jgi:hypothetical protein
LKKISLLSESFFDFFVSPRIKLAWRDPLVVPRIGMGWTCVRSSIRLRRRGGLAGVSGNRAVRILCRFSARKALVFLANSISSTEGLKLNLFRKFSINKKQRTFFHHALFHHLLECTTRKKKEEVSQKILIFLNTTY